jgi:glutathione peroxidase
MFYRNYFLIIISLVMFSFLEKVEAKYDKLFFDLSINDIDNKLVNLSEYKGKIILLVNVASKCGFTKQYSGLQALYDKYKEKNFVVIGVPSNQFGNQEPGSNDEIKDFCATNFNITFPIMDKIMVKGKDAHPIYKWAKENYGNSTVPKWNFHKILINKEGKIHDTFGSFTEPLSIKIKKQIELLL